MSATDTLSQSRTRIVSAAQNLPPHSIPDEQALLGCCLESPEAAKATIEKLHGKPDAFYDLRHDLIFTAMVALARSNTGINHFEVQRWLLDRKQLEQVGGAAYFGELDKAFPTVGVYETFLEVVHDRWIRRKALEAQEEFARVIRDPSHKIETGLLGLMNGVGAIADLATKTDVLRAANLSLRRPDEILNMRFEDSDRILGDHLLQKGAPLTILGAGGIGKSRLLLQMAACCIAGRDFLGFATRGQDLRWLILQGENSNRRLKNDLLSIYRWAGKDWPAIAQNLFLHTIEHEGDGFLSLENPENVSRLERLIDETEPHILVVDPLNAFGIGSLNDDRDMTATCRALSSLQRRGNPDRALIVLHHALTGKAGAARAMGYDRASFGRNSKALLGWTRAQINITPGSAENNESLIVSCGKCSDGREFERFAIQLNPDTMIYEVDPHFDFEAWEGEVTGKKSDSASVTIELVADLCRSPKTKKELVSALMEETGCGKTIAYRKIDHATQAKKIHLNRINDTYVTK